MSYHHDAKDNVPSLKSGKPRCQEVVCRYIGMWSHYGQCERGAKVGDRCKQHDPVAVKARLQATSDREDRQWEERRKELYGKHFLKVLRQIAEGHNDPRTLAKETIEGFE